MPGRALRQGAPITTGLTWLLALAFMWAGLNHFRSPAAFIRIVPPQLPSPALLVAISGGAEILGGLGMLLPYIRRPAGWGLIALLVAVFPANVYMLMHNIPLGNTSFPRLLLWLRLPLQGVLIALVWWCAVRRPAAESHAR